jgi:hypothetical protein
VGLKRGPLSLVSTTEWLLERKTSCFGLENKKYDRRDLSCGIRGTLYPQKLALTSTTSEARCNSNDQVRKDEMGGACSTNVGKKERIGGKNTVGKKKTEVRG